MTSTPSKATAGAVINYDDDIAAFPHKLIVDSYRPEWSAHRCRVMGTNRTVLVDLFVSGDLPKDATEENLVGKTVEVGYTHGFIFIGENVRIAADEDRAAISRATGEASLASRDDERGE